MRQFKLLNIADSEVVSIEGGGTSVNSPNEPKNDEDQLDETDNNPDDFHSISSDDAGDDQDTIHGIDRNDTGNNPMILRRSYRERRQPDRYGDWEMYAHFALSAEEFVENDPRTIKEAKRRDDWEQWKLAIHSEYNALIKNGTWTVCSLPIGRKPVLCKCVFKLKRNAEGEIDKYKARLVARDFSHRRVSISTKLMRLWQS